jgi:hypothetical protein
VVWWTQPWASRRRGGTKRRCTRRGGLTAARDSSGEQSREQQSSNDQIKGAGRFLTLRGSAGSRGNGGGARTQWGDGGEALAAQESLR